MVLDWKSLQEYPVNVGVPQCFLVLHFFHYISMTSLIMLSVILLCADDNTLYAKCDQASDLWQQLELASELESDLRDNVE